MNAKELKLPISICAAIVAVQTSFLLIPTHAIHFYTMAFRPVMYAVLMVIVLVLVGKDRRPIPKGYISNFIAILSIVIFCLVALVVSVIFGMGRNLATANLNLVAQNLWQVGLVVVLGEVIRYKLIKGSDQLSRSKVVVFLTIALAYGYVDSFRMMMVPDLTLGTVFFESMFRAIIISGVASYFVIKGSLLSVVIISFFYTMIPYLSPVLPNVSPIAFSLMTSGLVLVTAIIYSIFINDKSKEERIREKRMLKYAKKPILFNTATGIVVVAIVAFLVGLFPVYPISVLSDSMEPTFDRGSMVFIERVSPDQVYHMVGEGYVIHFEGRGRVSTIHRVVDFRLDSDGQRVYITQGDANYMIDTHPVAQEDVLGVARASIPFLGYPYIAFRAVVAAFQ